jgi:MFS family permease
LLQIDEDFSTVQRWLIVAGAFLSLLSIGIIITSFSIFLKPISNDFGWERAAMSLAASIAMIIAGIASILAGRLADQFSPKLITTICGVFGGCACLLMSRIQELWHLYIVFGLLAGISMSNAIPAMSLVSRCVKRQRGLLTGISLSGGGIGSIIAAPIIARLIDIYNWRNSYFIVGITVLILVIIATFCLRDPKVKRISSHPAHNSVSDSDKANRSVNAILYLRSEIFWIITIILICVTFIQQVIVIHLVPHITDSGISALIAATVISVITGINGIGNLFAGRVVDMIGSRLSMIIGFLILLLSMVVLLFATQIWSFFLFAILYGIAWGITTTLRFTTVAEVFGVTAQGSITGIMMFICNVGGAISPLIAGYIFDVSGSYQISFFIITGICLTGLIGSVWLKFKAT